MDPDSQYFQERAYILRKALEDAAEEGLTRPDSKIALVLDNRRRWYKRKTLEDNLAFYIRELDWQLNYYKRMLREEDRRVTKEEKERRLAIKKVN
jgi:hypothetical protein